MTFQLNKLPCLGLIRVPLEKRRDPALGGLVVVVHPAAREKDEVPDKVVAHALQDTDLLRGGSDFRILDVPEVPDLLRGSGRSRVISKTASTPPGHRKGFHASMPAVKSML